MLITAPSICLLDGVEQLAKIGELLRLGETIESGAGPLIVDVAEGDNVLVFDPAEVGIALPAQPDDGQIETIARGILAQHGRRDKQRDGNRTTRGQGRTLENLTTR